VSLTKRLIEILILLLTFFYGCTVVHCLDPQTSAVAVWDLDNLGLVDGIGADMGELLAATVIDTLKSTGAFQVIERQRLILVLEELNRSSTSVVDEQSRLKIGRIVGARFMVFGSYFVFAGKMRLDLRLVEVETSITVKAAQGTTSADDLNGWLKTAREAAEELI
jgi:curli biogenesis system outer membrane secretion channel CsgG